MQSSRKCPERQRTTTQWSIIVTNDPRRGAATKILFIDDDTYLSNSYIYALRDEGYEVSEVTGVDAALAAARRTDFAVVVLDMMLPHGKFFDAFETQGGFKTGLALARELRNILPEAKLLALTMSTDPEVQEWLAWTTPSRTRTNARSSRPMSFAS